MKIKKIYRLLLLPSLLHELLHCLPAWLWGLEPRIDKEWSRMRHIRTTDGKAMVIVLTPAFVGLLFLPVIWRMIERQVPFYFAATLFWFGWMLACGKDFYKAGHFLFHGNWHDKKET